MLNNQLVKVLGLQERIYYQERFDGIQTLKKSHILVLRDMGNKCNYFVKFTLKDYDSDSDPPGYMAHIECWSSNKYISLTHVPKIRTCVKITDLTNSTISNNVFNYSMFGTDNWNPTGSYTINLDLFDKTARYKNKRQVWVFTGKAKTGKTFLASLWAKNFSKYETSTEFYIPELYQDIIIVGKGHTFKNVVNKIVGPCDIIRVEFNIYHENFVIEPWLNAIQI